MSADKLRLLPPQLMRYVRNHGHAKFRSAFQSSTRHTSGSRPGLILEFRGMSSVAWPLEEMNTIDVSLARKTGDSHTIPTAPRDDEAVKTTTERKVAILWDLDNKTPLALPEDIATSIRSLATKRGKIVEYSAMANIHAFIGLPLAAKELKKDRLRLLAAEKQGKYKPAEPYMCPMCGSKFATNKKLQRHYKQLHERERRKKLVHLGRTKGKKKEKLVKELEKRQRAHIMIKAPEQEHNVFRSLKRAGVLVRVVSKAPQAADKALNNRFAHVEKNSGLTLIIISDDSDFCKMVQNAKRNHGVHVIVIGEYPHGKLAQVADEWFSWETLNNNAQYKNESLLYEDLTGQPEAEEGGSNSDPDYVIDDDVVKELLS